MNSVVISGNLGQDPELRTSQAGKPYCKFSLAIREFRKDEHTTWANCVCFGKTAEYVGEKTGKGDSLCVSGRLEIKPFEGNDGVKKYYTTIVCNDIELIKSSGNGSSRAAKQEEFSSQVKDLVESNKPVAPAEITDDDIPF